MLILLHSSKTTRQPDTVMTEGSPKGQLPPLSTHARSLMAQLKQLSSGQLQGIMKLSEPMAQKVFDAIQAWDAQGATLPAIDLFLGDIYSGLQVQSLSNDERAYANKHLYILSGLYGVLRALDEIQPYRLEMGYRLPEAGSMYSFWGDAIMQALPKSSLIINLSAEEYTKAIFPHMKRDEYWKTVPIVSPKFMTVSAKTGRPAFVTVHAKIARGAFARWLIQNQVKTTDELSSFAELGYTYSPSLSTKDQPVFVAKEFKGTGLSVRLVQNAKSHQRGSEPRR